MTPRKWEDVDHELSGSVAGALTPGLSADGEQDPLGLGRRIECVIRPSFRKLVLNPIPCSMSTLDMESSMFPPDRHISYIPHASPRGSYSAVFKDIRP